MRGVLLMLVLLPGVSIIFGYTKANIWSFWLGFFLCILLESAILVSYCFLKAQKAYRDSFNIKLQENCSMNLKEEYPFPKEFFINDKIYLNKYTEEAFLNYKKEVLKSPAVDEKLEDLNFSEVSCKKELQEYIDQIRQKCCCLNRFNQALVIFGTRIKTISDSALLIKKLYHFAQHETYFKDSSFSSEFRDEERRAFNELKVKLKCPKASSQGIILGRSEAGNGQEIVLPMWRGVLEAMQKMGAQFQQIELMRRSNSEMIEMINRKVFQDYDILEKEMSETIRSLGQIRQNLENLKEEQKKLDKEESKASETNGSEFILWLKQQYYQFNNLSVRIKQNENNFKRGLQKVRYYTSKITTFYKRQKDKYDSIVFTRYISFLDTYNITLEESLKALNRVFNEEGYAYDLATDPGPPKVKEMIRSKNMNEVLAAEITYHQEYFERVEYYRRKIGIMLENLESMEQFLSRLRGIFGQLLFHLGPSSPTARRPPYFRILYDELAIQASRICEIVENLQKVNHTLHKQNQPQLFEMEKRVQDKREQAQRLLGRVTAAEGPIREKYRLVKADLTQIYKEMQETIASVKYFQQVYQKHQNRIKKILLVSFIQFINYQKKMICNQGEGDYLRKTADLVQTNLEENLLDVTKIDLTEDISYQNQNRLQTGYLLGEEYKALLNRFLFVAYTEWSQSQLFKSTISKEIYIALNQQDNESLEEIVIEDFQLTGQPPQLLWVKEILSQEGEFIIDANVSFRGKILMKISTTYNTFISIPVELQISIEEFYSVVRLCFIVNELGCSWFSFVGEPILKVIVTPRVGSVQINFESIISMFQRIFIKKLKENIYPVKKKISIPLYKKDDSYEIIQNRFRMGMEG